MPTPDGPISVERASIADVAAELRLVIDKGLPVTNATAGKLLPNLRSVYARAVIPSDAQSRLDAVNDLLPRLIASVSDGVYREALQVLFGLAPGTRGAGLMSRRRQAADAMDYSVGHFRDAIEEELLDALAVLIYNDLLRYESRVKRASESLEPTGDTPTLQAEDLTHEEELVSRIWSAVYALRAELIAGARLQVRQGFEAQVEDHRQAAGQQQRALQELIREYVETYGALLIRHGTAEFSLEALKRLAGWET